MRSVAYFVINISQTPTKDGFNSIATCAVKNLYMFNAAAPLTVIKKVVALPGKCKRKMFKYIRPYEG